MEKISISPEWVFSPQPMYIIGTKNEDGTPNFSVPIPSGKGKEVPTSFEAKVIVK